MYAIIQSGSEQIRVSAGDEIAVQKVEGEANAEVVLDKILMVAKDGSFVFGAPYVSGASVKAEIVKTEKTGKVLVYGPQPKKAIHKLKGHRQLYTTLKIKEIIGG
ncbi:MAG TPA: 50S ribosomal protein L21 [Dissulfurispiraceae bacterium]|nr:50S ribosomal protein L21 [Dissulfurispiraceae bacterium]